MKRKRQSPSAPNPEPHASRLNPQASPQASPPRIIGGRFRGRRLLYEADPRTRPMKDRVREALFNLIGPSVKGMHAIDLFAGTGALGIEALSRGAASATFVEQHFPTAEMIRRNLEILEAADAATILPANVLLWSRRLPPLPDRPWLVFCSPPWALFAELPDEMVALLETILAHAPAESQLVVEADEHWDFGRLPRTADWSIRAYSPAVIGILKT